MPVYWSGLLLFLAVFWCYVTCVLTVKNKAKTVVFSYASASHPHVATLSHHYRAPPEDQGQYLPLSEHISHQYIPPLAGQNEHFPNSGIQNISPPSSVDQSYQPAQHPEDFHDQGGPNEGNVHYNDRNSDIYQPSVGSPTPSYDYTTIRPYDYESTTAVYHTRQPVENHYHQPHPATELPSDYDHSLGDHSTLPTDLGYPSTPIYYNDRPPDYSPDIQPDPPQGYDHSSISLSHPTETYHDGFKNHYHHSPGLPHDQGQQFHDYTTPQPIQYNNDYSNSTSTSHIYYDDPQNSPAGETEPSSFNQTHPQHSNQNVNSAGSLNQNFPDYQAPASPEYFDYSTHLPRGGKFSPLPSSSTQVYYEDETEYISTTPIIEFESVKEKPLPIKDYSPPQPGYVSKPAKTSFNQRKKVEREHTTRSPPEASDKTYSPSQPGFISKSTKNSSNRRRKVEREQQTRSPPKASDKSSVVYHTSDKVLQKPKYFAYSSDFPDDHDNINDSNAEQIGNQSENDEDHDHEQKKKDEKYAKGGGQEHHSGHKATAGDKGDKGYKSEHKHEEGKKGHHEKEDHKGKYVDEKGKKGKKEEESGHYGEHHKAEKGKKGAKYGESGEHKKGHSTKGEHNIHKMDEYMKKHEFYDEHHEGGDHEKFGGFKEAHTYKKGGKKKKGHQNGGHHQKHRGKKGHHEKGHKLGTQKGHKDAKGYDGHFSKHKKYGKKGGSKKGKKWGYSKGHPPK